MDHTYHNLPLVCLPENALQLPVPRLSVQTVCVCVCICIYIYVCICDTPHGALLVCHSSESMCARMGISALTSLKVKPH